MPVDDFYGCSYTSGSLANHSLCRGPSLHSCLLHTACCQSAQDTSACTQPEGWWEAAAAEGFQDMAVDLQTCIIECGGGRDGVLVNLCGWVKVEDIPLVPTFPQPMIQQLEDVLKVSLGLGSLTGATFFENVIFFFSLTKARSLT